MVNDDWHERLSPEDVSAFIDNLQGARPGVAHRVPLARGGKA